MSPHRSVFTPTPSPDTSALPPGFTEQVMRAVGRTARPSPARALWSAMRDGSMAEARGALSVAWRLVGRTASMPVAVRAQALALVVGVVFVAGSVVGGGAFGVVVAYETVGPMVASIPGPVGDPPRTVPSEAPVVAPELHPAPGAVAPDQPDIPDRQQTKATIEPDDAVDGDVGETDADEGDVDETRPKDADDGDGDEAEADDGDSVETSPDDRDGDEAEADDGDADDRDADEERPEDADDGDGDEAEANDGRADEIGPDDADETEAP